MAGVPKHDIHEAAARPLKRARAWAWTVFWVTAGSSVLYNCYHALVGQHMPWYTGVPEGFVPLLVAIGVLEFSGAWRENKVLQGAAWLVTGGAMAWSAFATNSVVHQGWAFGLIADTAALSAMYFLLNGPTAAQAVEAVAQKIAELTAAAHGERSAREQAEAAHQAALSDLRALADAEIGRLRAACESAQHELESARQDATGALDQAEALRAKLDAASARKKPAKASASGRAASSATGDADPTNELRAVMELRADPDLRRPRMGGELARRLGIGASTGRRLHGALVKDGALSEYAESLIEPLGERSQ